MNQFQHWKPSNVAWKEKDLKHERQELLKKQQELVRKLQEISSDLGDIQQTRAKRRRITLTAGVFTEVYDKTGAAD